MGPGCHPRKTYPKQTTKTGALNFMSSCGPIQWQPRRVKPLTSDFGLCLGGLVDTPKRENTEKQGNLKQRVYVVFPGIYPGNKGYHHHYHHHHHHHHHQQQPFFKIERCLQFLKLRNSPGFRFFPHIIGRFRSLENRCFFPTLRQPAEIDTTQLVAGGDIFGPSKPRSAAPLATNWRLAELNAVGFAPPAPGFWRFPADLRPRPGSWLVRENRNKGHSTCEAVVLSICHVKLYLF